jgi:SAM-dependent methyltransferase
MPATLVDAFSEREGCPFCGGAGTLPPLCEVEYSDTAEATRLVRSVPGKLFECSACGVAFPSHAYDPGVFALLYDKKFRDLDGFDRSVLQRLRMAVLSRMARAHHLRVSLSRLLDVLTLRVLQVPALGRPPRGLRILDVGCGFGEFLKIYTALGNDVIGTEIVPALVERLRRQGFVCRHGELHNLDLGHHMFDVIIMRAVFYRTLAPVHTLEKALAHLAPGGEVVLLDPCPGRDGADYFFYKQFPQGQFYVIDRDRYFGMLRRRFGLRCEAARLIYGRPNAPLKSLTWFGHVWGLGELLAANLLRRKPYVLSYRLSR